MCVSVCVSVCVCVCVCVCARARTRMCCKFATGENAGVWYCSVSVCDHSVVVCVECFVELIVTIMHALRALLESSTL